MHLTDPSQIFQERTRLERLGIVVFRWAGIIGLAGLGISLILGMSLENGFDRFYRSYLVSFCYFLSLSLGALFFVMFQHLTRAAWSVVVRRIAEIVAAATPLFVALFVPLIFGLGSLYHWTHGDAVAQDPLLQSKAGYLNVVFFMVRCAIYFAFWWGITQFLLRRSVRQDESGDPGLTLTMEKASMPGMFAFAFTLTFAAFDLLMSLDPHWYSTIYGVYYFSGAAVGFMALLTVLCFLLQKSGRLVRAITIEHYHDLGKFLFAFTLFWAYIAFSQYLLIWYGNIPEETIFFYRRQEGQWLWGSLFLLFGHFIIPFLGLLSRYPKRRRGLLTAWAVWMLVAHWFDIYWLVMPQFNPGVIPFSLLDVSCLLGIGGVYIAVLARIARGHSLVPMRDPRLGASLTFENA